MNDTSRFAKIEVDLQASSASTPSSARDAAARRDDDVYRVAILGDFSGRRNRRLREPRTLADRKVIPIDRDLFDDVFEQLNVGLTLPSAGTSSEPVKLAFRELDDFHPDRIFDQVDRFAKLRSMRRRLTNPETFAAAAAELCGAPDKTEPSPPSDTKDAGSTDAPDDDAPAREDSSGRVADEDNADLGLLNATLAATETPAQPPASESTGSDLVDRLLREIVAPHILPAPDPRQPELIASVDAATAEQMRTLLHDPDFQALESAWRGLYLLVRRLETGRRLKLFLVDVSKDELAADCAQHAEPDTSSLDRLLVEPSVGTAGGKPWSLILGDFSFSADRSDVELLERLARIADRAGARFVAGAEPDVVGCTAFDQTPDPDDWQTDPASEAARNWRTLRGIPEASRLELALPRFLLRLPYGRKTSPIESFDFEELDRCPIHEQYLWGNPVWACGLVLAEQRVDPDDVDVAGVYEVDGLPLHVHEDEDGHASVKPCAESVLTERAIRAVGSHGLTALVSVRGSDSIRIAGLRSLAGR